MIERKAVVAFVINDGKLLMGKKQESAEGRLSGKWHIPGETLNPGETDELGLTRGVLEEVGIEIIPGKHLGSHTTEKGTKVNWYECEPRSTDIKAGSDLEEVEWVPFDEVKARCYPEATSLWPEGILKFF